MKGKKLIKTNVLKNFLVGLTISHDMGSKAALKC